MISFASDYVAGAHPEIIKRLAETNMENLSGYGTDPYCAQAAEKIRQYGSTSSAGTSGRRQRQRQRRRRKIWRRGSFNSTPSGKEDPALRLRRIRRGRRSLKRALSTRRRTISCGRLRRSSTIWSLRLRWSGSSAATLASARRRSRCGRS